MLWRRLGRNDTSLRLRFLDGCKLRQPPQPQAGEVHLLMLRQKKVAERSAVGGMQIPTAERSATNDLGRQVCSFVFRLLQI